MSKLNRIHFQYIYCQYLVFLTSPTSNQSDVITSIFELAHSEYILNIYIIARETAPSQRVLVYQYSPFARHSCHRVHTQLAYVFQNETMTHPNTALFPIRLRNFFQCPIYVSAACGKNIVELIRNINGTIIDVGGLEGNLLKAISNYLNFRLIITEVNHTFRSKNFFAKKYGFPLFFDWVSNNKGLLVVGC